LGDGSTVTYYWYRFADQPALLNADIDPALIVTPPKGMKVGYVPIVTKQGLEK